MKFEMCVQKIACSFVLRDLLGGRRLMLLSPLAPIDITLKAPPGPKLERVEANRPLAGDY